MSGSNPQRKRDRLLSSFRSLASGSASPGPASRPTPVQPTITSPQTIDQFLQDTFRLLTEKERLVVQKHLASDISTTVQAAYDAATFQKNLCEQKRWQGSDKADKVLHWLDRFKSVGDVIANVDPVHVSLPWAGIRLLLEAALADSRQMRALFSGMELALSTAERLRAYLIYYKHLPPGTTTDNLRKALTKLYAHVLRFLATAVEICSQNTAVRKVKAFWRDSDLTTFESVCDNLGTRADIEANNCDRELRTQQWAAAAQWKQDLATTLQQLDRIRSIESSLNLLQVKVNLSRLRRVEAATYNSTVEEKLPRCLNGTRSQILHDITQWAAEQDGKPIFWLCGQAGTGKSTISRTFARELDKQGCLGGSFFFKRGEMDRSNADQFFSTITAQLADLIPQLQVPVAAALDRDSFLCGRGIQEQFEKLLLEPLQSISSAHLPRREIILVIDALDECERDTDIQMFLRLLTRIKPQGALSLRIFLTSRPELPIRLGFRRLDGSLHQDVVLEEVQEATIHGDIRAYFDHEFAKIKEAQQDNVQLPKDWPSEPAIQTLVALAVPLFIFAATVCRFVAISNPQKRLNIILERQHRVGSSQMAKLYLPILDQLLYEKEEEDQQKTLAEFREVAGLIVLAADPLSVTSLASLLGIDKRNIHHCLDQLHSVLQVPLDEQAPVRLLHQSFRDFLVDPERKDKSGFWLDEVETHRKLASYCLRRLDESTALRSDICCVMQPGARRVAYSAQHVAKHIPADVAYACSYWPLHLVKSKDPLLDDSTAHNFLKRHLLHWLEALSWLGRLSIAISSISELSSIAQGNNSVAVSRFLGDAKRFVLRNRFIIDLAPLQVYHSAIIFAPMHSIVRQAFDHHSTPLWALLPKVPLNWSAEMQKLEGHDHRVNAVAFSPDGQIIASASDDQTVRLWNAATGEQTQKLKGHDYRVNAVAFSLDGQIIASASDDQTVRLWNAATGEQTQKLEGHDNRVKAVAFSPDGQIIASASDDQTVRLWNAATGEQTQKLEGHNNLVNAVAFSPDGQIIASASDDQTVRLWNTATGEQTQKLEGHYHWVNTVAFSPDGQIIVSASDDQTVRLWNTATGEQTQKLKGHNNRVNAVAFSPDGQMIASASDDQTVRLWNTATGEPTQKLEGHHHWVKTVAFSPDGQMIASASNDQTVRLWNAAIGEQTQKLEGHNVWVNAVAFSPDGQMIASASNDQTVRLWNTATGEPTQKLEGHDHRVNAVAFSPDGQIIASASDDQTVRLWNTATGKQTQKLEGHYHWVNTVAFSPDGQMIASASDDWTVRLWNAVTGEQTQKLEGHDNQVNAVAFSPDGQMIASASDDWTARLWNVATGEMIELILTVNQVYHVSFSSDGKSLQTNVGTFPLKQAVLGSPMDISTRTTSLELKDQWLRSQDDDLLWLPHEYRGTCSAIYNQSLVIGQASGAVSIFRLK